MIGWRLIIASAYDCDAIEANISRRDELYVYNMTKIVSYIIAKAKIPRLPFCEIIREPTYKQAKL